MSARRIYLLGGTSFARRLAAGLEGAGYAVRLSVATPLGAETVDRVPSGGIQAGRLTGDGLCEELRAWDADVLVDGGHPYARELRETAETAAALAGIPLLRACRRPWRPDNGDRVRRFRDEAELTEELLRSGACAFFTVGSQGIRPFAEAGVVGGARVLPTGGSMAALDAIGVPPKKVIAAHPPYSPEFTAACMRHTGCAVLVSKDSGEEGGLNEKLEAVRLMDGELYVLDQPQEHRAPAFDLEGLLAELAEL